MIVTKATLNQSITLRIVDSTDGTPETGVISTTTGIDMWYRREAATFTAITEATLAALTTAHTDGGIRHIRDGWYRLDVPDAAFATGVDGVQIGGTLTGMVVHAPYVQLSDADMFDGVRLGLTALPNAAADAAGGLPLSDDGGLDIDAVAVIATAVGTDGTNLTEAGGTGDQLTAINLPNQTMDIVGSITGNLSGSVGSVTAGVTLAAGAVTDASLAGGLEIVFETDFATNYNVTRNAWVTNGTDFIGTGWNVGKTGYTLTATTGLGNQTANITGNLSGSIGSNTELGPTEVNAEVVDVLFTDTDAEPGAGAPGATISLADKIGFLYKAWRNRSTQTATVYSLYNDDATTVDHDATVSDDTTTADRGEMTAGP